MKFEFATATRIIFGCGALAEAPKVAREFSGGVFVVTGSSAGRAAPLIEQLNANELSVVGVSLTQGEPMIQSVACAAAEARALRSSVVIAIGGGSAIDAGKAIAALATNEGDPLDFLEVIGRGQPLRRAPLPFIAIPTTAGTGAEVTRNAVLSSPEHRVKVSLRSPWMLPRAAIIDPELTHGAPPDVTAASGMDALTQLIEAFVCTRANPMTDALCREALPRAAQALAAFAAGDFNNREAREAMAFAALSSGLALANAGLGAVHGFAAPLGGMFEAPHGAVCAVLLPHVMRANLLALRQRDPSGQALERFEEVAERITGDASAMADDGVHCVAELCRAFGLVSLGKIGVQPGEEDEVVRRSQSASSMKANPIQLTSEELRGILLDAG